MTNLVTQTSRNQKGSLIALGAIFVVILLTMVALIPISGWASSFHIYRVPSSSMAPTILKDVRIIVNERYYDEHPLADGDIITFRHQENTLVKRISALPGETIEGKDGVLIRNGQPLVEPYAVRSPDESISALETFPLRKVPAGEIFVTGDSRDQSLDSRSTEFVPVQVKDVIGKVVYIFPSSHK